MANINTCITPEGRAKLEAELHALWDVERPGVVRTVSWAAGNGDRSENGDYIYGKKRLRQIDSRVRYLRKKLKFLTVFDPADQVERDRIYFGATVTYADEEDIERRVTLVGAEEIDTARGRISLASPIGRALLKKTVGDLVTLDLPAGEMEIEILSINYPVPE